MIESNIGSCEGNEEVAHLMYDKITTIVRSNGIIRPALQKWIDRGFKDQDESKMVRITQANDPEFLPRIHQHLVSGYDFKCELKLD